MSTKVFSYSVKTKLWYSCKYYFRKKC